MNPFAAAIGSMHAALASPGVAGVEIRYERGSVSRTFAAVPGDERSQADGGGFGVTARDREWIIAAADIAEAGFDAPKSGDRIEHIADGVLTRYQVQRGDAADAWRWSDPGQTRMRVRSSQISREAVAT